jgi:hypothetical protein
MNNLGVIYKVTNLLNNKIYIGKTIQKLDKRKNAHFNVSKKSNTYFQNDKNEFIGTTYEWALLNKYPIHSSRNIVYTGKYKNWKLNKII